MDMMTQINRIAFDIDGVIRDIYRVLEDKYHFRCKSYNQKHNGKDFWAMLSETPDLFEIAPTTKYYKVVKELLSKPEFWSFQRKPYREQTVRWLDKHFDGYKIKFFNSLEEKYHHLKSNKNYLLIEDSDQFPEYSRIVLVDKHYNRRIDSAYRITKEKQLASIIMGVYHDKN